MIRTRVHRISLGRKINPRLSNIGAADGLQIEKSFGRFADGSSCRYQTRLF